MKKILLTSFLAITMSFTIQAQFGLNLSYNRISADAWNDAVISNQTDRLVQSGFGIAADYWIRLKNIRIEFLPTIGLTGRYANTLENELLYKAEFFSFTVNTNIYPLDIKGDCNCPTFGKDGSVIDKGWYIQVGPGVSYLITYLRDGENPQDVRNDITYHVGIGTGLDLGLAEYFTVTPFFRYNLNFSSTWHELTKFVAPSGNGDDIEDNPKEIMLGVRLGYRWDYKK